MTILNPTYQQNLDFKLSIHSIFLERNLIFYENQDLFLNLLLFLKSFQKNLLGFLRIVFFFLIFHLNFYQFFISLKLHLLYVFILIQTIYINL